MNNEHLLTVQEVADFARVKPYRIIKAARSGELESIPIGDGTKRIHARRFTREAVNRWIKSLTEPNTKEPTIILLS